MRINAAIISLTICLFLVACAGTKEAKVGDITAVTVKKESPEKVDMRFKAQSPAEVEREALVLKTLKNPPVPLKGQNKIVRVLFLPYVDQNGVLHAQQYAFVQVEEGKWIMGDYLLTQPKTGKRLFKPLENPAPAESSGTSPSQPNVKSSPGAVKEAPIEASLTQKQN